MTDWRCRYFLVHHAACASLRLFAGRSCCPECTHGHTLPPTLTTRPGHSSVVRVGRVDQPICTTTWPTTPAGALGFDQPEEDTDA